MIIISHPLFEKNGSFRTSFVIDRVDCDNHMLYFGDVYCGTWRMGWLAMPCQPCTADTHYREYGQCEDLHTCTVET